MSVGQRQDVRIVIGRSRQPTLQLVSTGQYLHSLYDPVREARALVHSWPIQEGTERLLVLGLGLGYHVSECLKMHPGILSVVVLEWNPDVVRAARACCPALFTDERIQLVCPETEDELAAFCAKADLVNACFHPPSLATVPYPRIQWLLQEMQMLRVSAQQQAPRLERNFAANLPHLQASSVLTGRAGQYRNQIGLFAAAGPSLDTVLTDLDRLRRAGVIVAAAAPVLKLLLKADIQPTMAVLSDSSHKSLPYIDSLSDKSLPPLYALPTVDPNVPNRYTGPVWWALQSGFEPVEAYARQHHFETFPTGGSVATLGLSLLYYFGCDPIIFAGQDLAYVDGAAYAAGAHSQQVNESQSQITVTSVFGQAIPTTLSWNAFRHWIEEFICAHPDRTYLNASRGADIRGTKPINLADFDADDLVHERLKRAGDLDGC